MCYPRWTFGHMPLLTIIMDNQRLIIISSIGLLMTLMTSQLPNGLCPFEPYFWVTVTRSMSWFLSYTTTSQTDRVNKQFHASYVCWPPATEYNNININVRLNWGFMSTPSGFTMTGLLADKWGRRLNTEENKQCSPVFCKSALVGKLDAIYTLFVLQFCSPKYQYLSVLLQKLTNVLL